jgi:hypothetical protein
MTAPENPRDPMPPRPVPAAVGRAIAAALVTGGSTAELERIVRDYVRDLRVASLAPEQALKRVKDVVGLSTVMPIAGRGPLTSDRLADEVVRWFVAEYYRAD